ncbi:hypothetical protein BD413DRAFT_523674 [Trametes elegans]|nr:hypothetical protein BD413DRAFT_523674 [Trametes elegans]
MGAALLTYLKAFLRRALRRRAAPPSLTLKSLLGIAELLGPVNFAVDGFENQYLTHCGELIRRSFTVPGTRDSLSSAYISELKLLKERVSPEHEYIVAHVSVRLKDSGPPVFLGAIKAERTVRESVTAEQHASFVVDDSILGSVSASSTPLSSPSPAIEAFDHVFVYNPGDVAELNRNDHRLLYRCKYEQVGPSFPTFVASAIALHIHSPEYRPAHHPSFWFAAMLFRMVGGEDAEVMDAHDKTDKVWLFVADKSVTAEPGRLMDVFRIVTQKAIAEEYAKVEPALQARIAEKSNVLVRVREDKEGELRQAAAKATENAALQVWWAALQQKKAAKAAAIAARDV